jgi:hypothetical protein
MFNAYKSNQVKNCFIISMGHSFEDAKPWLQLWDVFDEMVLVT